MKWRSLLWVLQAWPSRPLAKARWRFVLNVWKAQRPLPAPAPRPDKPLLSKPDACVPTQTQRDAFLRLHAGTRSDCFHRRP